MILLSSYNHDFCEAAAWVLLSILFYFFQVLLSLRLLYLFPGFLFFDFSSPADVRGLWNWSER